MTTPFHAKYWASLLTLRHAAGSLDSLSRSIASARVDLNPHQVEAALFALRSPLTRGVILADEVGLGKTIEAGLVIAQRWAERKRRLLLIVPATLRRQWQAELESKFGLPCLILDGDVIAKMERDGVVGAFNVGERVIIVSYHFASARSLDLANAPWDLVVIDEAHRMRNVFQPSSVMARRIVEAIGSSPKLLLTATPLQNSLMELYGLASVIDPRLFGDAASFRDQFVRAPDEGERDRELKERLRPVSMRTLRRQVREYIPFTNRVPITQDFTPSDEENALYEDVSAWLQKEELLSLPASQRTLMTLVLRKLLASSTFAIAATLDRLAKRLEEHADELLDEDDLEEIEELRDELDEDTVEGMKEQAKSVRDMRVEIAELRGFVERARRITSNARGDALVEALRVAFERAEKLGAARKAVVFTESRRTQRYLADLLASRGYAGHIVLMNGTNADAESARILDAWLEARTPGAPASGSRPVDMKAAIVDHFRDRATIMVATEAAAEGVNLQFCSLVVNYDLPWNPQRIEQRIGRCHRYGQKHDVVVVNFINRRNEADQRVYELLSQKFRLFDGVFGSSDEVLGALESGVDIERRIAAVYQTCRTPDEIRAAFDKLQAELDGQIQARMASTRATLLENFDEEVSGRLRVNRDKTIEALGERERWLLSLARFELATDADFDSDRPRFAYHGAEAEPGGYNLEWRDAEARGERFFNQEHPLAQLLIRRAADRPLEASEVRFEYHADRGVISPLRDLAGRSGWMECARLAVDSLEREEFLLFAARRDDGTAVPAEVCTRFFSLPATLDGPVRDAGPSLAPDLDAEMAARHRDIDLRNGRHFDDEVVKLELWSEDLKYGLERELKDVDRQIREARRKMREGASLEEKLNLQREVRRLEFVRSVNRKRLFEAQDDIDKKRDGLIAEIERQLAKKSTRDPIFRIRWTIRPVS